MWCHLAASSMVITIIELMTTDHVEGAMRSCYFGPPPPPDPGNTNPYHWMKQAAYQIQKNCQGKCQTPPAPPGTSINMTEIVDDSVGPRRDISVCIDRAQKMIAYLQEHAKEFQGNPAALLDAVDKYCYEKDPMMHVGDKKGAFVRNIVQELAPKTCLELGTYCGYSAVLIASVLPEGSRFITVEPQEEHAAVARQFIKLAGKEVEDKITLVVKLSEDVIPNLRQDFSVDALDFVFLDHWKSLYTRDLKLLEAHGLMRKGTVIIADNIICPGVPDYTEYVQTSEKYQTELFESPTYSGKKDAVAKSVWLG